MIKFISIFWLSGCTFLQRLLGVGHRWETVQAALNWQRCHSCSQCVTGDFCSAYSNSCPYITHCLTFPCKRVQDSLLLIRFIVGWAFFLTVAFIIRPEACCRSLLLCWQFQHRVLQECFTKFIHTCQQSQSPVSAPVSGQKLHYLDPTQTQLLLSWWQLVTTHQKHTAVNVWQRWQGGSNKRQGALVAKRKCGVCYNLCFIYIYIYIYVWIYINVPVIEDWEGGAQCFFVRAGSVRNWKQWESLIENVHGEGQTKPRLWSDGASCLAAAT